MFEFRVGAALTVLTLMTGLISPSGPALSSEIAILPQVTTGYYHTCIIDESSKVKCWGRDDLGQTRVPRNLGVVTQVSAEHNTNCAVTNSGSVRCWGDNSQGQTDVPSDLGAVRQVDVGEHNVCAVTLAGTVKCWGRNWYGESSPPTGLLEVRQVSVGAAHACAVTNLGQVRCWGAAVGFNRTNPPSDLAHATQVSVGVSHACALLVSGTVSCWGSNSENQGSVGAEGLATSFSQIDAGASFNCGISTSNSVRCWGSNTWGQSDPLDLGLSGTVSQISAGLFHTCAVTTSRAVRCWGANPYGATEVPIPVQMPGTGHYYLFVSGSYTHDEARDLALNQTFRDMQGHLATIESKDENDWLRLATFRKIHWVGGLDASHDDAARRNWVWDSGIGEVKKFSLCSSDFWSASCRNFEDSFTDWNQDTGQPDGRGQDTGLVFANGFHVGGVWFDAPPSEQNGYIVEFEPKNFEPTSPPSLSGTSLPGHVLKVNLAGYPAGTSFSYQWLRDGAIVQNAQTPSYFVKASDVKRSISARIIASKSGYRTLNSTTNPVEISQKTFKVPLKPKVTGEYRVGSRLHAVFPALGSDVSYRYEWLRNSVPIDGTLGKTYIISPSDLGSTISFRVCASQEHYVDTCLVSDSGNLVGLGKFRQRPTPRIYLSTSKTGSVLYAVSGAWEPGVYLEVEWFRDGVLIEDQNSLTYKISETERGRVINVKVHANKPGFAPVTITSKGTKIN